MKKLLYIIGIFLLCGTLKVHAQCNIKAPAWPTYSPSNCTVQSMTDSSQFAIWWLLKNGINTNIFTFLNNNSDTAVYYADSTLVKTSTKITLPATLKNTYITDISVNILDSNTTGVGLNLTAYPVVKLDMYNGSNTLTKCINAWTVCGSVQFLPTSLHLQTPVKLPVGYYLKMDLVTHGSPSNKIAWMLALKGYTANF